MKLSKLSNAAQDGLRQWTKWQYEDALLLDSIGSLPDGWAWMLMQLKIAEDRPEWFPKGKWATLQIIEADLVEEARRLRREV